jgi:hypothetical protein
MVTEGSCSKAADGLPVDAATTSSVGSLGEYLTQAPLFCARTVRGIVLY